MAAMMENLKSWTSRHSKKIPIQGVVKRDWVPTGRIDFATRLNGTAADADQPSEFKLLVEDAGSSKASPGTKISRFNGGLPR